VSPSSPPRMPVLPHLPFHSSDTNKGNNSPTITSLQSLAVSPLSLPSLQPDDPPAIDGKAPAVVPLPLPFSPSLSLFKFKLRLSPAPLLLYHTFTRLAHPSHHVHHRRRLCISPPSEETLSVKWLPAFFFLSLSHSMLIHASPVSGTAPCRRTEPRPTPPLSVRRPSSPPMLVSVAIAYSLLASTPGSSSRGEHRLPDSFSHERTPQHRRPHAGEPHVAPFR
jgi:hypothetical protein